MKISESVIDPKVKNFDKLIFANPEDKKPILLDAIRQQILIGANNFLTYVKDIKNIYLVGSILTKHYSEKADIDVNLEIPFPEKDFEDNDALWSFFEASNGKLAGQSLHPINYYLKFIPKQKKSFEEKYADFDNVYDIISNKWKKQTKDVSVNVDKYLDEFNSAIKEIDLATMELRRDLIDIKKLKIFKNGEIEDLNKKVQKKLDKITKDIEKIINAKDEIHKNRQIAFKKPLSPSQLKKYKSKNQLPENVIYKLAEYYYIWELAENLRSIIEETNSVEKEDIIDIKDALEEFMTKNI